MRDELTSDRLILRRLSFSDAGFILELVNTAGWLKFIGDRKVNTIAAAEGYIEKILQSNNIWYWVVKLKHNDTPVGIITFIKRTYLDHPDIGFAFLPAYGGKGYAEEAAVVILHEAAQNTGEPYILATTLKDNSSSIKLLEKLGLRLEKEIEVEGERLLLYRQATDKIMIDKLVKNFFSVFTNKKNQQPQWKLIQELCLPQAMIIKKEGAAEEIYDLKSFMEPRMKILSDGTLTDFEEKEVNAENRIAGNIAQRFCMYEKSGNMRGTSFKGKGTKLFQFIKTVAGWKISAVIWEDTASLPIV